LIIIEARVGSLVVRRSAKPIVVLKELVRIKTLCPDQLARFWGHRRREIDRRLLFHGFIYYLSINKMV
jgi:hypothetical protein